MDIWHGDSGMARYSVFGRTHEEYPVRDRHDASLDLRTYFTELQ